MTEPLDFHVPPVSACCGAAIVFYRPDAYCFVRFQAMDERPTELRCGRCNRIVG